MFKLFLVNIILAIYVSLGLIDQDILSWFQYNQFLFISEDFIYKINNSELSLLQGEYRIVPAAIHQCADQSKNLPFKANFYLSKKSTNITEVKGNMSLKIPFDDSLTLDVNIASWSLTGGWKPNSLIYVTNNACSKTKSILGNAWYSFLKAINSTTTNCPIPMGVYLSAGYDTALLNDNNFPKVYFYGKYKYVGKMKNKNNTVVGCIAAEYSLVRPWEST